jgi:hypothetical protein
VLDALRIEVAELGLVWLLVWLGKEGERKERKRVKTEKDAWRREEREREIFLIIKITYGEATVLPNVLGSTVPSQGSPSKIGYLLWNDFLTFSKFFLF